MRLPYTICKRGKFWYCTVIIRKDGIDKRKVFISKQTSKIKSKEICDDLLKKGLLYLDSEIKPDIFSVITQKLGEFLKPVHILEKQ